MEQAPKHTKRPNRIALLHGFVHGREGIHLADAALHRRREEGTYSVTAVAKYPAWAQARLPLFNAIDTRV